MKNRNAIPIVLSTLVLAFTIFFIGCGGSGSNGESDSDSTELVNVSGYVLDKNSNPIAGAEVTISSNPITVITDVDGYFSANVEVGLHEITIKKDSTTIYSTTFICEKDSPLYMDEIGTSYQTCTDSDSDTYYAESGCGTAVDCDDSNTTIYPGATELCDGYDNQCPGDAGYGNVDEGCTHPGMALIPFGCFDMGDAFHEGGPAELPVHNVCVTSDFHMDVHEVTNAEYASCVSAGGCTAPSNSSSATRGSYYGNPTYDGFPVIYVSWNQANDYCAWAGKRLPTEAEWEYAARGGLSGKRYPWGDTISFTDANYGYSGDPWDNDTSPVEYYAANGYGLYDMAGNIWEWVHDWYQSDYYSVSPTNDPPGPASGSYRVLRGGSWSYFIFPTHYLRVAYRGYPSPPVQSNGIGFRCAGD